ncbi:hypothetical protein IAR55_002516 [Kwoniella newhampshirensis]|uniref:Protein phosphatase n=1 Tax=Kwoniella newhampshirensis TaxID=1651941 RepID=A0AAW0Z1N8_9TREE
MSEPTTIITVSPSKRLRSCLSPTRSRPASPMDADLRPTPSGSRSTSFSSYTSCSTNDGWKRTKSVRWQEMNGCAVASFHDTYSHDEYDRTPLEPPSTAERACVLPERGARCLAVARECFLGDSDEELEDEDEDSGSHPASFSTDGHSFDSYALHTPPSTETNSDDGDEDEDHTGRHQGEDKEWEECMERRRMMFARMCPREGVSGEDGDRHPEFEGYRSISATLIELLKSVGCDDAEEGGSDQFQHPIIEEDEQEESHGDDDRGEAHGTLQFGSLPTSIRTVEVEEEIDVDTPSLVSSTDMDSELDCCIASPGGMDGGIIPSPSGGKEILTQGGGLMGWGVSAAPAEKVGRGRDRTVVER